VEVEWDNGQNGGNGNKCDFRNSDGIWENFQKIYTKEWKWK